MAVESKKNMIIISLMIATFLTAIEGTIVSTAVPKIVDDLGGSHLYTWVISIYLLATVIMTPVFGKLADLFGRKRVFLTGIVIFLIGSSLCGFSQTMGQLVFFRLIQGIGSGGLASIPFTIIGDVFSFEERAKVQGWLSSVWGVSGIIGPVVGGFIVDTISWHWIFFMNIPFGVASIIMLSYSFKEKIEKKKQMIDYGGIFVFAVTMTSFMYLLTLLKEERSLSSTSITLFLISVIGLILFFIIEKRAKEPMMPLSLFKNRFIVIANFSGFLLGFILITASYYIPLWVQGVSGLTATMSGIATFPMSTLWLIGAILAGRLLPKYSIGFVSTVGIVIITIGCLGLTLMKTDTTIPFMMGVTAIQGLGFGLAMTTLTVTVQSAVEWKVRGAAMGSHSLMKGLGQAIGISISGLWLSDELKGAPLESGLHSAFVLLLILGVICFIVNGAFLGRRRMEMKEEH